MDIYPPHHFIFDPSCPIFGVSFSAKSFNRGRPSGFPNESLPMTCRILRDSRHGTPSPDHNCTITVPRDYIVRKLKSLGFYNLLIFFGARGRNRTGTGLPPRDFKSLASTCSATRAFMTLPDSAVGSQSNRLRNCMSSIRFLGSFFDVTPKVTLAHAVLRAPLPLATWQQGRCRPTQKWILQIIWSLGRGTSAASRCMNSSSAITMWVVPSR